MAPLRSDPASAGTLLLAKVTKYEWALSVSQVNPSLCSIPLSDPKDWVNSYGGDESPDAKNPEAFLTAPHWHLHSSPRCISVLHVQKSPSKARAFEDLVSATGKVLLMGKRTSRVTSALDAAFQPAGNNNRIKVCDPVTGTLWPALVCQCSNNRRDNGKTTLASTAFTTRWPFFSFEPQHCSKSRTPDLVVVPTNCYAMFPECLLSVCVSKLDAGTTGTAVCNLRQHSRRPVIEGAIQVVNSS